jgi:hypothetical protein
MSRKDEARKSNEQHRPGRRLGNGLDGNGDGIPDEAAAPAAAVQAGDRCPGSANDDVQVGSLGQINLAADGGAVTTCFNAATSGSALRADRGHEVEGRLRNGVFLDASGVAEIGRPDQNVTIARVDVGGLQDVSQRGIDIGAAAAAAVRAAAAGITPPPPPLKLRSSPPPPPPKPPKLNPKKPPPPAKLGEVERQSRRSRLRHCSTSRPPRQRCRRSRRTTRSPRAAIDAIAARRGDLAAQTGSLYAGAAATACSDDKRKRGMRRLGGGERPCEGHCARANHRSCVHGDPPLASCEDQLSLRRR